MGIRWRLNPRRFSRRWLTSCGGWRAREENRRESILALCTNLEQSVASAARLPRRAGLIAGPCSGDRAAAFEACRALDVTPGSCVALLERVPCSHMDTGPAVRQLIALREAVATAIRTPSTRP